MQTFIQRLAWFFLNLLRFCRFSFLFGAIAFPSPTSHCLLDELGSRRSVNISWPQADVSVFIGKSGFLGMTADAGAKVPGEPCDGRDHDDDYANPKQASRKMAPPLGHRQLRVRSAPKSEKRSEKQPDELQQTLDDRCNPIE